METLEQLKDIIKNAPDGATHYVVDQYDFTEGYFKLENCIAYCDYGADGWKYVEGAAIELNGTHEFRSLSDIKLIIELMEGQKKAYQAYVALEEIKQKYNGENKIAKELLKLAYECDEFALPSDLRKDIKNFMGDL